MNFKKIALLASLAALTICSPLHAKNVMNGILSFENSSTPKKIVFLNGDWEFYENQTFETLMGARLKVNFIKVPASWSKQEIEQGETVSRFGSNTYRLLITGLKANYDYAIFSRKTPLYASRIFANGRLIFESGRFARHKNDYKPSRSSLFAPTPSNKDGVIEIVVQVSNYTGGESGIVAPVLFGELGTVEKFFQKLIIINALLIGLLFFCFLSDLFLWIFDHERFANLLFAILLGLIAVRFSLYNVNFFNMLGVAIPFGFQFKLENAIIFAPCVFAFLYPVDKTFYNKHPVIDRFIAAANFSAFIIFLCLPIGFAVDVMKYQVIWALIFTAYSIVRAFFAFKNQQYVAGLYMILYTIVAVSLAGDILFPMLVEDKTYLMSELFVPLMAFFDIAYFAAVLEIHQKQDKKIKNELAQFYFGYRRFLPRNALRYFDNKNITDLKIGLNKENKVTIMFIGIVVISPDNTKINLREEFETLAFYSATIIDKIHQLGGTVITITNQGISILFDDGDEKALDAARIIRNELKTINSRRAEDYYLCVSFNISIHNGELLLGVIGDRNRLDITTISSSIEVIDKMCSLGFAMNIPILISQPAVDSFPAQAKEKLKLLGNIHFSEFTRPIGLYGLPSDEEEDSKLEIIDETPFITQREADKYINF